MNEVIEAEAALQEYVAIQEKLCAALFSKYGAAQDRFITNIPSSGLLKLDDEVWNCKKHGLGVEFKRMSDLVIVDVHEHIVSCPACVDPWRLVQYLETKHIRKLNLGVKVFDAQDKKSLGEMLDELFRVGRAVRCESGNAFVLKF